MVMLLIGVMYIRLLVTHASSSFNLVSLDVDFSSWYVECRNGTTSKEVGPLLAVYLRIHTSYKTQTRLIDWRKVVAFNV